MLSPLHDVRRYQCPGESGDITHAVHLARLAAGYGKCRECPFHAAGDLSHCQRDTSSFGTTKPWQRMPAGFRGIYLNQMGRQQAIEWAAALAALLWNELPPVLFPAGDAGQETDISRHRHAPVVVVGYDERPASPELVAGAVMGLTRMSCQVVEIGLTTEPCLRFTVQQFGADAGLLITGAGCQVSRIGFDAIRQHGLPPDDQFLNDWAELQGTSNSRRSRSAGQLRAFSPVADYELHLWKHFHALRPLNVVCGNASQQALIRLQRMLVRLPGRLTTIRLPVRLRDLSDPADDDIQRVGQCVQQQEAQLGIVMDEDGASCAFLDERGQLVPAIQWQQLMIEHLLDDEPNGNVVLGTSVWDDLAPKVASNHGVPLLVAESDRAARLLAEQAVVAMGSDHRLWFRGKNPTCDAIVTLAVMMQVLSCSDADFSQRLARG